MKSLFDRVVALFLLIVCFPLLLLLFLLIRFKLGAPVLFVQERPGRYGKPFLLYKFRTMTNQRDASGQLLPDAQRLTPFGMRLRAYSLDELPQLWNVLRGELSLVGPRPLLMEYLPLYTPRQMKRHEVLPGMTGWAQVNGRNAITWEQKFELDVWYVENRSFWLDLKILLLTVKRVFPKTGIRCEAGSTVEKFTGSTQAEPVRREMGEFDRAYESG
ncbi:sugar transferase [Brevibacillus sp. SAFN-007a]|uniref:sugar transferase n=1 Tax=Brevibacillus sp. SAFN-007a TaxID=3436862 RepID=UPI003F7F14FC